MPATRVKLSNIVPTQTYWDQSKVDDIAAQGPKKAGVDPVVGKLGSKYYLLDGHHRVAGAIQRGDDKIRVKRVK